MTDARTSKPTMLIAELTVRFSPCDTLELTNVWNDIWPAVPSFHPFNLTLMILQLVFALATPWN